MIAPVPVHCFSITFIVMKEFQKQKFLSLNLRNRFACHGGCPLSGRYCHPSFLWLSSLPARMKKIRSEFFFQSVNINIVFRNSRVANSAARDGIGTKFELIETFMDFLVTCKNEEDQNKIEGARVLTIFLPFAQGQLTQHSPSIKAGFRTNLRFMVTRVKKGAISCRHMATRVLIPFGP